MSIANLKILLDSLGKVEKFKFNVSATKMARETTKQLEKALSNMNNIDC